MPGHGGAARGRGRPRTFDREAALQTALDVFWRRGFEDTSMTDLTGAMGIASPSLYAAFGSKEDLFREAVDLYTRTRGAVVIDILREERDLRTALARALKAVIDVFSGFAEPRGCLVVLGVGPLGADNPVRGLLRAERRRIRGEIRGRFDRAIRDGQIAADMDVEASAAIVMAFYNGLSVEILDGAHRATLHRCVDLLVERLMLA